MPRRGLHKPNVLAGFQPFCCNSVVHTYLLLHNMAYIHKRGDRWNAVIRRRGQPSLSATFGRKSDAERWAREQELKFDRGVEHAPVDLTFEQAVNRYLTEVSVNHKGHRWEVIRFGLLLNMVDFRLKQIQKINDIDIQNWRDERLTQVSGASVNREMNLISGLFTTAIKDWKIRMEHNPCSLVRRPEKSVPRWRRIEPGELADIIGELEEVRSRRGGTKQTVARMVRFAVETGLRCSELCNLEWNDVHDTHVHVAESKNGNSRDVPLTKAARDVLAGISRDEPKPFNTTPAVVDATFRRAKKNLGIEDLHFHDTRHEACSRLAQKLTVLELAAVIGHKDLRSLQIYYNPTVAELASKLCN